MAYRKPFTPLQRREAVRAYRSYRKHYSQLRRDYRPRNNRQAEVLLGYRDAIGEMAKLLRGTDRSVNVDSLNRADAWARWLAMEYWHMRGEKD